MRYRADIDGLRAVAVIPVVLFHAGVEAFGGGYVGVDVFFVISGYLITSIIAREIAAGTFTIAGFYERRVRRIFPALFLVVGCCLAAGYFLYLPAEYEEVAQSAVAITAFASNMLFWYNAGYFDGPSEIKPLLHTWSLSVEEQFYVVFPIFLMFAFRFLGRRKTHGLIVLCLLASLAGSQLLLPRWSTTAFFVAPARAWELGLGAILALGMVPVAKGMWTNLVFGVAGLAMIAWSVFAYSAETSFPGLAAVPPCLGAALLIHAGEGRHPSPVGRLLALPPVVLVGLVSYSLYLWHWPVLVFARYVVVEPLTTAETAAALAASSVFAVLSWRYVERPFRSRHRIRSRRAVFVFGGGVMAAALVAGLAVFQQGGLPGRVPQEVSAILAVEREYNPRRGDCFGRSPGDVRERGLCRIGDGAGEPSFIVWGDSHADMLIPVFHNLANAAGSVGLAAAAGACAGLLGVTRTGPATTPDCEGFNDAVMDVIRHTPSIAKAALIGYWTLYDDPHGSRLVDWRQPGPWGEPDLAKFKRGFARTVDALRERGIAVYIVGPSPSLAAPAPRALARAEWFDEAVDLSVDREEFLESARPSREVFADFAARNEIHLIRIYDRLCPQKDCLYEKDGRLLYRDTHHLTFAGVDLVAPAFRQMFSDEPAIPQRP